MKVTVNAAFKSFFDGSTQGLKATFVVFKQTQRRSDDFAHGGVPTL